MYVSPSLPLVTIKSRTLPQDHLGFQSFRKTLPNPHPQEDLIQALGPLGFTAAQISTPINVIDSSYFLPVILIPLSLVALLIELGSLMTSCKQQGKRYATLLTVPSVHRPSLLHAPSRFSCIFQTIFVFKTPENAVTQNTRCASRNTKPLEWSQGQVTVLCMTGCKGI